MTLRLCASPHVKWSSADALGTPFGLGSLYSLVLCFQMLAVIIMRLLDEEKLLWENLSGYLEYCHRVKYRLVPGVY